VTTNALDTKQHNVNLHQWFMRAGMQRCFNAAMFVSILVVNLKNEMQ
jgi:hypothetical protein